MLAKFTETNFVRKNCNDLCRVTDGIFIVIFYTIIDRQNMHGTRSHVNNRVIKYKEHILVTKISV